MKIPLLSIADQQRFIIKEGNKHNVQQLQKNSLVLEIEPITEIDETLYSYTHLLHDDRGWEAPEPDIVGAYFRHFQEHFKEYNTDKKLAGLLGLSSDRRVREFKNGARKVPYDIWRRFLIMTGRVNQDVIEVLAIVPIIR